MSSASGSSVSSPKIKTVRGNDRLGSISSQLVYAEGKHQRLVEDASKKKRLSRTNKDDISAWKKFSKKIQSILEFFDDDD
jgi:hypothetical protein